MNIDAIIPSRNTIVYLAPFLTSNAVVSADSVDYGTAFASPYVDMGSTQEGTHLTISVDFDEIFVDQMLDPVMLVMSKRELHITSQLAEFTPANLAAGLGIGASTDSAATNSAKGVKLYKVTGASSPKEKTVAIDVENPHDGEPVRIYGWRGMPMVNLDSQFGISSDNPKVPIDFRLMPDDSVTPARVLDVQYISAMTA